MHIRTHYFKLAPHMTSLASKIYMCVNLED